MRHQHSTISRGANLGPQNVSLYRQLIQFASDHKIELNFQMALETDSVPKLDANQLKIVEEEIVIEISDIERLLSIGEIFQPEEAASILDRRLKVKLVKELIFRVCDFSVEADFLSLDALIRQKLSKQSAKYVRKLFRELYNSTS